MLGNRLWETQKKTRYARSFLSRRLVHVNLQLHYDCNFRCRICDFWHSPRKELGAMSVAEVRTVGQKLARIGPQIVSIGGGEPLLHPDIVAIVEALARDHFPVMICNGWFVTPALARELFAAGMYEVSVSVDYANPEKHDRQRGVGGAHARALEALETLMQSRAHSYQRVHMISVVMDDNLDEIEPLIQICRELDITYLVTLYSDSRGKKRSRAIPADVSQRLLDLKTRYDEFVVLEGYVRAFSRAVADGGIGPCYAGKHLFNIDCRGDVSLCIDTVNEPVGNILTDDIFVLREHLLEVHRNRECSACWTSCRGAIETLMYGERRYRNLLDYYRMTRSVRL